MRMKAFRVENFRSISDSGWVEIDDIAVIVGKNEAGKTSLLKALWKFKPFKKVPYDINREWPRGRRTERSEDKTVVTVRFNFTEEEQKRIGDIDDSCKGIDSVQIRRNYKGSYIYEFLPHNPERDHKLKWVVSVIEENLDEMSQAFSEYFKTNFKLAISSLIKEIRKEGGSSAAIQKLNDLKSKLSSFAQGNDNNLISALNVQIDIAMVELKANPPMRKAIDMVHEWLPSFIYMDDYKIFNGSAQLDHILENKKRNQLTDEDRTVIMIMDMAGLNLEDEVRKAQQEDREQRMLDMNDASQSLTSEIAARWTQKKYEVMFQADGQHFITFVKDTDSKILVPLEERSKGFQWFFSFDMTFMYETDGQFENAVILLDEPGLHLHAAAQRDLLMRMKAYALQNQLIYTTHLPFMIDFTRLNNIFVAEEVAGQGTTVHQNWATADKDARFTLQAALGLSWSQSLFVGQYNLVVEGVTDFWFLTCISNLLSQEGHESIDDDLVITPAGGASKVAYVGTILHAQELNVAVLLDSDQEGKSAFEQLVHQWILDDKHVLMIGNILGISHPCALEDLFAPEFYLKYVNRAYTHELKDKSIKIENYGTAPIVDSVDSEFRKMDLGKFNKGRVAKMIMNDLSVLKLDDLGTETIGRFKAIVLTLNNIVKTWKKNGIK